MRLAKLGQGLGQRVPHLRRHLPSVDEWLARLDYIAKSTGADRDPAQGA